MKKKIIIGVAILVIGSILLTLLAFSFKKAKDIYSTPRDINKIENYNIQKDSLDKAKNKVQNELIIKNTVSIEAGVKKGMKHDSLFLVTVEKIFKELRDIKWQNKAIMNHNKAAAKEWEKDKKYRDNELYISN